MKPLRKILPILLAFCLLFVPSFAASASEVSTGDAEIASREEVIYANLAADGTVRQVYAVTALNVSRAGTLTDYGDYSHAVSLTSTDLLRARITPSASRGHRRLYYRLPDAIYAAVGYPYRLYARRHRHHAGRAAGKSSSM